MKRFFSGVTTLCLLMAGMQIVWLLVGKAYADYGWLGVLVVLSVGLPFAFVLVPLLAWWLFPGLQAQILYALLAVAAASAFLSTVGQPANNG